MEKFENLRMAVIKEWNDYKNATIRNIENSDASVKYCALHDASTEKRWNQFLNNEISEAQAKEYAIKRVKKQCDKYMDRDLTKISNVSRMENDVTYIDVSVEYLKGRVIAEISTNHCVRKIDLKNGYGANARAVSSALNECYDILNLLYQYKDKRLAETDYRPCDNQKLISEHGVNYYGILPEFALFSDMKRDLKYILGLLGFEEAISFRGESYDLYHFMIEAECKVA